VLAALAAPSSFLQALAPVDARRYWWIGYAAFPTATYVDQDAAAQWLGGPGVEGLAALAARQITGFYEASAVLQNKPLDPLTYFAEKHLPNLPLQRFVAELFPPRKEIFLVRDFRDMVASIFAFNRQRNSRGFGVDVRAGQEEYIAAQAVAVESLMECWSAAGEHGLLLRYEDLVREPQAALARVLDWLGLDSSDEVIAAMRSGAAVVDPGAQAAHRTSADALASLGRWRRDLGPELRDLCEAAFADALRRCGYCD
jgi:hypothetical protein